MTHRVRRSEKTDTAPAKAGEEVAARLRQRKSPGKRSHVGSPQGSSFGPSADQAAASTGAPVHVPYAGADPVSQALGVVPAAARAELDRYFGQVEKEQWQYYFDHVNAKTNFLPPDNVTIEQGRPAVVDYRTSPTNIGLYMLSAITAAELGLLDTNGALERLRQTVETLKQLPRYTTTVVGADGQSHPVEHLYNWYSINGQPREIGNGFISTVDNGNFVAFLVAVKTALGGLDPQLSQDLTEMIQKARFDVLYDPAQGLLAHGGQVQNGQLTLTGGRYDMLISEARSAYAVAILGGQIPPTAWTNLKGKLDKEIDGLNVNEALDFQSYTGTMFEYLTPRLLMKHGGTPLGTADEQAVLLQMAETAGDIWGKSEAMSDVDYAAYGARSLTQSRQFTGPGVEVIAPYASQMAAQLAPAAVAENLQRMEQHGLRGRYGFYESTVVKTDEQGQPVYKVVPKYYAHHIGMGLLGMANFSLGDVLTDWFQGSELNRDRVLEGLLSTPPERYRKPLAERPAAPQITNAYAYEAPVSYAKDQVIGSDDFVAHVPAVGGSTWANQNYALAHNEFFWVRDNAAGQLLPFRLDAPDAVTTHPGGKTFDYSLDVPGGEVGLSVDVSVPAGEKVKVSKITIHNQTGRELDLQVAGYLEWIMDDINAYLNHPVYRNLFVETQVDQASGVILARRRTAQGSEQARQPFSFLALGGDGARPDYVETSRTQFLGRLGSLTAPRALLEGTSPGAKDGSTLDPAAALARSVKVPAGGDGEVSFVVGVADSPKEARETVERLARGGERRELEPGTPHFPPDTTFSKMAELYRRTLREGRIKSTPVVAPTASPEALGHFANAGRTYVIDQPLATPKPWSMVASNGRMGFVANASGWAYSFGINSQQNRITPYVPDNTTELPLQGVMVKDRTSGESFSISPNPAPSANGQYRVEMSPGQIKYVFTRRDGLELSLTRSVGEKDPVELWTVDIENGSKQDADLELSSFLKWALGANFPASAAQTQVEYDSATRAVLARSGDSIVPGGVAFHTVAGGANVTSNGLFGTPDDPFTGLDVGVKVAPGGRRQLAFVLGQAADEVEARALVGKYQSMTAVTAEVQAAARKTERVLDGLQVSTPDPAIDAMLNTWLPYQAYFAHYLARSGYYQSGGAFGFRDQLQTVMNLLNTGSAELARVARAHLVDSARHQFEKGDVEHWWHPHNNLGQRSTISDNLLWLPYALEHYVDVTGDRSILSEQAPFAEGRELNPGELDYVQALPFSEATASVYQHAKRAIDLVLGERMGEHGLPLIGKGDWNDALDRVGHLGRGESVWLGFFLYAVLDKFIRLAEQQGDTATVRRYRAEAERLKANLNQSAWGDRYFLRAFTDDGEKVDFDDAIVQAWSVLSGAADPEKAERAIASAVEDLYRPDANEILLFDRTLDQESWGGALAAYPNGLRENNAQYTHGSSWLPRAVAEQGDGDLAMKLFKALLPTVHASDPRYGAEPYSVAADIYGGARAGEGGWTWYSGGPGWILRTGLEELLGIEFKGADGPHLLVDPCLPKEWPGYSASYKNGTATYQLEVKNPQGVSTGVESMRVDGVAVDPALGVSLVDDGQTHRVEVVMGPAGTRPSGARPSAAG